MTTGGGTREGRSNVGESSNEPIEIAKHVLDINVKNTNEKEACFIAGSAFLSDSILVLTDQSNASIKAVDVKKNRLSTCTKLTSKPWDVCKIADNQVAVALPSEQKVAFVMVKTSTICAYKKINVNGPCHGLDFKDDMLAVSFYAPPANDKIQVLNLQGTVLHEITNGRYYPECSKLKTPLYVAFGQTDATLYVSNYTGYSVVCIHFDGTIVASYDHVVELRAPTGIKVDSNGDVYVCIEYTSTLRKISKDCKHVRTILGPTDGLYRPWSISCNDTEDNFYVGMYANNCIKVFGTLFDSL